MSEYTVSTTRIRAIPRPTRAELLEQAITGLLGNIYDWVGSRELDAMAHSTGLTLGTSSDSRAVDIANHRRSIIASSPLAKALLREAAAPALRQADDLIRTSRRSLVTGDSARADALAEEADNLVRSALTTTSSRVAVEERRVLGDGARRALERLGYQVDLSDGRRSTGVWATRGKTVLAMLVQDGGVMELDTAGCVGDACKPVLAEVTQELEAEGLECEVVHSVKHGDDRGGQLISRAIAAAVDGRIAEGTVTQFERGLPQAAVTEATSSPTTRRRVAR